MIKAMVDEDIGTPLGYENRKGEVIANAHPNQEVNTVAVFVMTICSPTSKCRVNWNPD